MNGWILYLMIIVLSFAVAWGFYDVEHKFKTMDDRLTNIEFSK